MRASLRVTSSVNDLVSQTSGFMLHPLGLETRVTRPIAQRLARHNVFERKRYGGDETVLEARKGKPHFAAVTKISAGVPSSSIRAVRYLSSGIVVDGKSLDPLSARLRMPEICLQNASIQNERSVHN